MILTIALASLAALSLLLLVWQVLVAARFPLHQRTNIAGFAPGITILKPLKGCDTESRECLRSWLIQDYAGPIQVLFGVASAQDPVCQIAQGLIAEYPGCEVRLVVCGERLGPNAKVAQLIQLERLAQHEVICVSDADVWIPPDFLPSAVASLRDPRVGLVNCLYRLAKPAGFAMRWEAFAVNADFWSQVLQSLSLRPMDFALGAAMVMPRRQLAVIGGFTALVDYLADDYQLGHRTARSGERIELCPVVVECRSAPMSVVEVWRHQLRWARTIQVCQPGPFFLSVLANASLWPLLWLTAAPSLSSAVGASFCFSARMAAGLYLERKLNRKWNVSSCWLAPVKDILQVAIWALAFTGRQVTWRGERYRVEAGGRLVRLTNAAPVTISSARTNLQTK